MAEAATPSGSAVSMTTASFSARPEMPDDVERQKVDEEIVEIAGPHLMTVAPIEKLQMEDVAFVLDSPHPNQQLSAD